MTPTAGRGGRGGGGGLAGLVPSFRMLDLQTSEVARIKIGNPFVRNPRYALDVINTSDAARVDKMPAYTQFMPVIDKKYVIFSSKNCIN